MTDPIQFIHQYYTPDTALYNMLIKHSEQVRDKALEVAAAHPELNLDTTFITEAAMLHDVGIFLCHAPDIFCYGNHHYIEHGYLGADLLRKGGLYKHALVCERHTGVGLTSKHITDQNLPLPNRDMLPVTLEEQVICYADKFYSKSHLTKIYTPEEIRKKLMRYGVENVQTFDAWHIRFA